MSECCEGEADCCQEVKHEFWDWWSKKDRTFTKDEVAALLEEVKTFNCGAIDEYLSRHVDRVFQTWAEKLKG